MEGNPICVQIPWDKNPEALAKWAEGRTGFPWIDAIMTQLRQEGWIHHLARHAVACFLSRGDLWISWEEGMKVSVLTGIAFEGAYNYSRSIWKSGLHRDTHASALRSEKAILGCSVRWGRGSTCLFCILAFQGIKQIIIDSWRAWC